MQPLFEIVPDARRSQIAYVRAQRLVAVQMSYLLPRILQTHQPEEPSVSAYR